MILLLVRPNPLRGWAMYLRVNQPFGLVYDHYLRPRTYVLGHVKNKKLAQPNLRLGCAINEHNQNPKGLGCAILLTAQDLRPGPCKKKSWRNKHTSCNPSGCNAILSTCYTQPPSGVVCINANQPLRVDLLLFKKNNGRLAATSTCYINITACTHTTVLHTHVHTQQQLTSSCMQLLLLTTTRSMLQVLVACMSQPFGVI